MSPDLGVSIGAAAVRSVLVQGATIRWVGEAACAGAADLPEVLARLASEPPLAARRVRIVFEREVTQLRAISPAPPLRAAAVRRYVALEAPRLFRQNGAVLVTDGLRLEPERGRPVVWAGAVAEPLVEAAVAGCAQGGLRVEALGPAADVLPYALARLPAPGEVAFPNGGTTEVLSWSRAGVWRSRHLPGAEGATPAWHPALAALEAAAPPFAAAFGATRAKPRLDFAPPSLGVARGHRAARRRRRTALLAAALWLAAAGLYAGRLARSSHVADLELRADGPAADTLLALRRNLDEATTTLATMALATRRRSRDVALLAALTRALGGSTYLVSLRVESDGTVRLAGYAPEATRVLANLDEVPVLTGARLEGAVTREPSPGGDPMDRFAIVAHAAAAGPETAPGAPLEAAP